jgi:hypothetical protein
MVLKPLQAVVVVSALSLAAAPARAIEFPKCSGAAVTPIAGADAADAQAGEVALLSSILLENEAGQGRVAYCLSDARMTNNKNGLSFGFNQYDLATNDQAKGVLVSLLKTARMADPMLALSEPDVAAIEAGKFAPTAHDLKAGDDLELVKLIDRVNAALSSVAARKAIDEDYAAWLKATIADFDGRAARLDDAIGARAYLRDGVLGRMLMMDYENFFGAMGNEFKHYLAGRAVALTGGTIQAEAPISFTDIMRFSLTTRQGAGAARDQRAEILRRINNVVKFYISQRGEIALLNRDIAYLAGDFKTILADESNSHIRKKRENGEYDALAGLVQRAEQKS